MKKRSVYTSKTREKIKFKSNQRTKIHVPQILIKIRMVADYVTANNVNEQRIKPVGRQWRKISVGS